MSEFPHVILNQARVHDFLLDVMHRSPTRLQPDYSRRVTDLTVDAGAPDHPITVTLVRADDASAGQVEVVRAGYVVGCDGARSTVRSAIGRTLQGDSANQVWGVMDVLAETDFPDVRRKSVIHSGSEGNMLIIPREGGYLVRLYIELEELAEGERIARDTITADRLVGAAQRILHPYTLDVREIAWWSVYEIGQRLCDRFDDVPDDEVGDRLPRVFIAGDACHTHSPKAGQGMNVSMRDAFNLGWKLAAVIREQAAPHLLDTYSAERHAVAEELIDFDREFARMFSAAPRAVDDAGGEGVDPSEFQSYFVRQGRFTAGTATRYNPSIITAEADPPAPGRRVGDRHAVPLRARYPAGGCQAGAPGARAQGGRSLAHHHVRRGRGSGHGHRRGAQPVHLPVGGSPVTGQALHVGGGGPRRRHRRARGVPAGPSRLELAALPSLLLPRKGRYGLIDYEKAFCPDLDGGADIFELRGIDRGGCIVIVRPDQHVATVLPLDAHAALADFFDAFMVKVGSLGR